MNSYDKDGRFELLIRATILCMEFYQLPVGLENNLERFSHIAGTPDAESKELIEGWIAKAMIHILALQFPEAPCALLTVSAYSYLLKRILIFLYPAAGHTARAVSPRDSCCSSTKQCT